MLENASILVADMRLFYCFLIISLTGISCSQEDSDNESTDQPRFASVREAVTIHQADTDELDLHASELIRTIYRERDQLLWLNRDSLTPQGWEFYQFLKDVRSYGLLPQDYHFESVDSILNTQLDTAHIFNSSPDLDALGSVEVLFTDAYFTALAHIQYGRLDTTGAAWFPVARLKEAVDYLFTAHAQNSVLASLEKAGPDHKPYHDLVAGCRSFLQQHPFTTERIVVPIEKSDSTKSKQLAARSLVLHGFADSTIMQSDSAFRAQLAKFQLDHGLDDDAKIGYRTAASLSLSNEDRWSLIAVTMDKWRKQEAYPENRIWVNIPAYKLHYYRNDSLIRTHRVVVGKPYTPTPEFEATLTYLSIYPYWHVPHSISTKEILPMVRYDTSYLRKYGYTVHTLDRETVSPGEVDWSRLSENYFPYRIRQNFGYGNSLGIIAFMFPNEHAVFIHDTPAKYFFSFGQRAFSHGCMRVQHPADLAKEIIAFDGQDDFDADSLQAKLDLHIQEKVYLRNKIPVIIQYFTSYTNDDGKFVIGSDIYGKDEEARQSFLRREPPNTDLTMTAGTEP